MKLAEIPKEEYSEYRFEVIFNAYKWDPQVEDKNTVARHVVLMDKNTAGELADLAEKLAQETNLIEEAFINKNKLELAKELGFSKKILKVLGRLKNYNPEENIRLMRFDFHPTETGWAVSEVNSDVPGGFAEASILPQIAKKYFENADNEKNIADILIDELEPKLDKDSTAAFVYATSYADDRQVMQFLSDSFNKKNINTIFAAPDQIVFKNKKAYSILDNDEKRLSALIRFYPLEWLVNLPRRAHWEDYYDTKTPSCNHPVAIFAQSKRLPIVWDKLGVEIPYWKKLLPQTIDPKELKKFDETWIFKPALGRVGEGILIKEAISEKEYKSILKDVQKYPKNWVAQRRFKSKPVQSDDGKSYHLCIGVFTVNGKFAGFYGRISPYALIDSKAEDIPILILKD